MTLALDEMLSNLHSTVLIATGYWTIAVVVIIVLAAFLLIRQLARPRRLPYQKRDSLITKSELKFFRSLQHAVAGHWEIFAMVRIADLVRVRKGVHKYRSWLNKILAKHVDFVICDLESLVPLVAIELDDSSHDRPERQQRDELVDQIFESCDFPLLRFKVQTEYSIKEIRRKIEKSL